MLNFKAYMGKDRDLLDISIICENCHRIISGKNKYSEVEVNAATRILNEVTQTINDEMHTEKGMPLNRFYEYYKVFMGLYHYKKINKER